MSAAAPARAQDGWLQDKVASAVNICAGGAVDAEGLIANARAAGWPAFESAPPEDGLTILTSFNNKPPVTATSPFVMIQVGVKSDVYPGGARLDQLACNVASSDHATDPQLAEDIAGRFPGFSGERWFGRLRGSGGVEALTADEMGRLAAIAAELGPDEALVSVELQDRESARVATVRFYTRRP